MKTSGSIKAITVAMIICLLGTIYCSVVLALDNKHEYVIINKEVLQSEESQINLENDMTVEPEELKVDVERLEDPDYVARYAREKYM